MVIRFLHVGRRLSAIQASSPFDQIFFDFQKTSVKTTGYNLFTKEYKPSKTNLLPAIRMKEAGETWKSTPQETKNKFNQRAQLENNKGVDFLLDQYLSDQQFQAKYEGNIFKVKSEVSKLYKNCLDISVKENRDFFLALEKMYNLKRDSVTNISKKWCYVNRTTKAEFQKLSAAEKTKIKNQYLSEYRMFLDQMTAAFPEREVPSFLLVEADENSEKYKHDVSIYRKIAQGNKNLKKVQAQKKKLKARVNEELAKHQLALRSKMGFTAGSEKKPLNAYMMFTIDLREKSKKTTSPKLSVGEIAQKWKSLSPNEKSVWENKQAAEIKKTKILNKGAVQRTIQAPIENCIALTMDEAKANLDDEQLRFYKQILTEKRKQITKQIEAELNSTKNN